ncbi:MAG TPA: hypothetical protein DHV48_00890 [Prolixibacteraceae bacterium]|nr:hypothetical protein [Prolixibacteraceae bacterium]
MTNIPQLTSFESKKIMCEVIRFNYLYRDSGNWKKFGNEEFSNPEKLTIEEIAQKIRENLIDHEYFYPDQVGIKKFRFHRYLDDYSWYEFESVEMVVNENLSRRELESIGSFFVRLQKMKSQDITSIQGQPIS